MCLFLGIALYLFVPMLIYSIKTAPTGNKKYREAKMLDEEKKYKEACYAYAVVLSKYPFFAPDCETRIKFLWYTYGPFNYDDILTEIKNNPQSISLTEEEHIAALSEIEEWT
jgi:hypothetical protein